MPTYLVTIFDKELRGEPDIALAVVEATDELAASHHAYLTLDALSIRGRGRCVARVKEIEPGHFYRLGALVRGSQKDVP
jgi:hypothetical protein